MLQAVKPRARNVRGVWMIQGSGIVTFGNSLDDALRLWRGCLLEYIGA